MKRRNSSISLVILILIVAVIAMAAIIVLPCILSVPEKQRLLMNQNNARQA